MNIVYYTPGGTGTGRIVRGIAIGNALKRAETEASFTILTSSSYSFLAEQAGFNTIAIPLEHEGQLSRENFHTSELYSALETLKPDILIIDLVWYVFHAFIDLLPFKKALLLRQVIGAFFSLPFPDGTVNIDPHQYDLILSIEPWECPIGNRQIDPIIIPNREELLPRDQAETELRLDPDDGSRCLIYMNGKPGEFEETEKNFNYLEGEGYTIVSSCSFHEGIFPVAKYFNAFDLVVCSGGYNSFWETRYFRKKAIYVPFPRKFEDQNKRIQENHDKTVKKNGADELVSLLLS